MSSGSGATTEWTGALEDYHIPTSPSETVFLDGCKVFLAGFSDNQLQKLHKIINLGGGARYVPCSARHTYVYTVYTCAQILSVRVSVIPSPCCVLCDTYILSVQV